VQFLAVSHCVALTLDVRANPQVLRVYADGALVARTDVNGQPNAYNVTVPVKSGSRYILAVTGSIGEPYGGYRGQPGLRCAPWRYPGDIARDRTESGLFDLFRVPWRYPGDTPSIEPKLVCLIFFEKAKGRGGYYIDVVSNLKIRFERDLLEIRAGGMLISLLCPAGCRLVFGAYRGMPFGHFGT